MDRKVNLRSLLFDSLYIIVHTHIFILFVFSCALDALLGAWRLQLYSSIINNSKFFLPSFFFFFCFFLDTIFNLFISLFLLTSFHFFTCVPSFCFCFCLHSFFNAQSSEPRFPSSRLVCNRFFVIKLWKRLESAFFLIKINLLMGKSKLHLRTTWKSMKSLSLFIHFIYIYLCE